MWGVSFISLPKMRNHSIVRDEFLKVEMKLVCIYISIIPPYNGKGLNGGQ